MKSENIIIDKTFDFAVRAVKAYTYITEKRNDYVIPKQFLKSATSIGANVEEAIGGQSKADFIAKISIAYKEARETRYWVRLMGKVEYLNEKETNSLLDDIEEILKICSKIITTTKNSKQ